MVKVVGVILARGGSRGIPRKNIKLLGGRPLIDWNIVAARDSGIFAEIWVSTDCDEIARVAEECGALVHRRSASSASHTASSEAGLFDFTDAHPEFDIISMIQCTSPLTMPSHFAEAFAMLDDVNADSLVTAVTQHRFLWKINEDGSAEAKNYDPVKRPLRQDW
jgi:N-acylneuraminate cytidylyltransferase